MTCTHRVLNPEAWRIARYCETVASDCCARVCEVPSAIIRNGTPFACTKERESALTVSGKVESVAPDTARSLTRHRAMHSLSAHVERVPHPLETSGGQERDIHLQQLAASGRHRLR